MNLRQKTVSHEGSLMIYEGKTSWEDYSGHLDIISAANDWSEERKGQKLASALRGPALGVALAMVPQEDRMNFIRLSTVLKLRFGQEHLSLKWQNELQSKEQRPDYSGHLDIISAANDWSEERKGQKLASALRGPALGVALAMVPQEDRMNFIRLSTVLKLRFGQEHSSLKWQNELQSKEQRPALKESRKKETRPEVDLIHNVIKTVDRLDLKVC
ncbi:hypothetical protein GE061_000558 [Apolygus lucorum]|uniref:Uncharacterized protein n=1 Tax=Apolygus lucorum TaxID=248454 RepID=A0A8S9Y6S8_APOLU|nr:hypothetical protein GE061_000558 [Apolygus lucorum]